MLNSRKILYVRTKWMAPIRHFFGITGVARVPQVPKMESLASLFNDYKQFCIVAKLSILHVCGGPGYAFVACLYLFFIKQFCIVAKLSILYVCGGPGYTFVACLYLFFIRSLPVSKLTKTINFISTLLRFSSMDKI